jgi:hypothetical protein
MAEQKRFIRGFLIKVYDDVKSEVTVFEDTLENIYGLLSVDLIDVTERQIGNFTYDIVCDDEGLFVEEYLPSAYDSKCQPQLVGNLLLVNHDEEGNFASLTDEQIKDLQKQMFTCVTEWQGKPHIYRALKNVEYA